MKVLVTLVLVLVLAGCATGQGNTSRTVAEEETTVQKGAGDLKRPPDSTLSYGGQEVKGSLGSYCWRYGNREVCADAAGFVPLRKKTLSVPAGSEMVFRYGGQKPPKKVEVAAYPLRKNGRSTASPNPNRSRSLKSQGSGVERTIPAELPQGEYVLDVFVTESQGDASYSFRVKVE